MPNDKLVYFYYFISNNVEGIQNKENQIIWIPEVLRNTHWAHVCPRNLFDIDRFVFLNNDRYSRPEVYCNKEVLKNFAKFRGKHLCQNLFLIKLQAEGCVFFSEFCEVFKNTSGRLFLSTRKYWKKVEILLKGVKWWKRRTRAYSILQNFTQYITNIKTLDNKLISTIYCLFQFNFFYINNIYLEMGQTKLCYHLPRPTTTHHDPPPPKIYPPPPTTIHHHPPPAKIYPPLPTTFQKMYHHPAKGDGWWVVVGGGIV